MPIDLTWDVLPPEVYDAVVDEVDFRFGASSASSSPTVCPTKARNISWMIG